MLEAQWAPVNNDNLSEGGQQFDAFLEGHPELNDLAARRSERVPFYLGHTLIDTVFTTEPTMWKTPDQTLTTGGWKYDGDVEDK